MGGRLQGNGRFVGTNGTISSEQIQETTDCYFEIGLAFDHYYEQELLCRAKSTPYNYNGHSPYHSILVCVHIIL